MVYAHNEASPKERLQHILNCVAGLKAEMELGIDQIVKVTTE